MKRRLKYISAGTLAVVFLVALLPWIVANTELRHWAVNRALANPRLEATVGSASFGWVAPLSLSGLEIADANRRVHIRVEQLHADRSWLQIARNLPAVGEVAIAKPHVDLVADGRLREIFNKPPPVTTARISDAQVRLRPAIDAQPAVDLEGVDLNVHIEPAASGRELWLEPVVLLDHEPMTSEMLDRGLQLVAPLVARATHMQGSVSLELDKLRVPLPADADPEALRNAQIEGRLKFHEVTAGLNNPVLANVASLVARILRRDLPTQMRIVEDTTIHFTCIDGRIHQHGLAFVLPELSSELVMVTGGSVGLDETLDLIVEIPLPLTELREGPLMRTIAERPIRLKVTGTLDNPQLGFDEQDQWLQGLVNDLLAEGQAQEIVSSIVEQLRGALGESAEGEAPLRSLLDDMRKRRAERREQLDENENTDDGERPRRRRRRLYRSNEGQQ